MEHPSSCWEKQNGKTTPGPALQTPWQSCWSQEGVVVLGSACTFPISPPKASIAHHLFLAFD